jgi:hypothetical protein
MRCLAILTAISMVGGCAYGESVFERQNQLGQRLASEIMLTEGKNPQIADRLYAFEDDLNFKCADLQKAASRKMGGGSLFWWEEVGVFFSLTGCDAAWQKITNSLASVK